MNKKRLAAIQRLATDDEVKAITIYGVSIMQLDAIMLRKTIVYLMKREIENRATLKNLKDFKNR